VGQAVSVSAVACAVDVLTLSAPLQMPRPTTIALRAIREVREMARGKRVQMKSAPATNIYQPRNR